MSERSTIYGACFEELFTVYISYRYQTEVGFCWDSVHFAGSDLVQVLLKEVSSLLTDISLCCEDLCYLKQTEIQSGQTYSAIYCAALYCNILYCTVPYWTELNCTLYLYHSDCIVPTANKD